MGVQTFGLEIVIVAEVVAEVKLSDSLCPMIKVKLGVLLALIFCKADTAPFVELTLKIEGSPEYKKKAPELSELGS